jgi:hypothetical protein
LNRIHITVASAEISLQATSFSLQMFGSHISTSSKLLVEFVKNRQVVISTSSCQRNVKGKRVFIDKMSDQWDSCDFQINARYRSKVRIAKAFCHVIVGLQKGPFDTLCRFGIQGRQQIEGSVASRSRLSIGNGNRVARCCADFNCNPIGPDRDTSIGKGYCP